MIVYVLFVHKKSVSKRKVGIIFIKKKFKKKPKKTFLVGFFGWAFFCQPCLVGVLVVFDEFWILLVLVRLLVVLHGLEDVLLAEVAHALFDELGPGLAQLIAVQAEPFQLWLVGHGRHHLQATRGPEPRKIISVLHQKRRGKFLLSY
jgi:hypothetical protein